MSAPCVLVTGFPTSFLALRVVRKLLRDRTDIPLRLVVQSKSLERAKLMLMIGLPTLVALALASFGGVKRRFTRTGEVAGVTVIDDVLLPALGSVGDDAVLVAVLV